MTRRSLALAAAVAAMCNAATIAALAVQQSPTSLAFGRIEGTVTTPGASEPIEGARVVVRLTSAQTKALVEAAANGATNIPQSILQIAQATVALGQTGGGRLMALTDPAGHFTLDVPVGTADVTAGKPGYFGTEFNGRSYDGPLEVATVTAGQPTIVHFSLMAGGTINGRVADAAGAPMMNIPVVAARIVFDRGRPSLTGLVMKNTDDRGEFRLFGVAPGDFRVVALVQKPGQPRPRIAPIDTFYPSAPDAATAAPVVVRSGEEVNGIEITVINTSTFSVSGRVLSTLPPHSEISAQPGTARPPFAFVSLVPRDVTRLPALTSGLTNAEIPARADGTFTIPNVAPGSYEIIARLPVSKGWGVANEPARAGQPWAFGMAAIDIGNSDLSDVAVTVKPGVDLAGRVLVDGKPEAANIGLWVQPDDSLGDYNRWFTMISDYAAPIDGNGSFTFPLLPEFHYRIGVEFGSGVAASAATAPGTPPIVLTALASRAYVADILKGGASVYDDGMDLSADATSPLDVIVKTNGATLTGEVDTANQPAPRATVVLVPDTNHRDNPLRYISDETDRRGHFELTHVPPGHYIAYAWVAAPLKDAYMNADYMRKYEGRGTAVTVAPSGTLTVNLTAIPAEPIR